MKTQMAIGDEIYVFDWFRIHFIENNGMAFGAELFGKLFLSVFRLVLVGMLFWLLKRMYTKSVHKAITTAFSLVLAGAIGNILDSLFYGVFFTHSDGQVAEFTMGNGYAPMLYGKVVDMLYFPIWKGYLPEWIPFKGGDYFVFFQPVFNIADSAITIAVFILLFYNKKMSEAFQLIERKK